MSEEVKMDTQEPQLNDAVKTIADLRTAFTQLISVADDWRRQVEAVRKDITKALAERDEALAQLAHHENSERYLGNCFEAGTLPDAWAALGDNELKEATEYYEKCKCFVCQWTRYELARREQMIRIVEQRDAALALAEQRRVEIESLSEMQILGMAWCPNCARIREVDFEGYANLDVSGGFVGGDVVCSDCAFIITCLYRPIAAPHTTEGKETK